MLAGLRLIPVLSAAVLLGSGPMLVTEAVAAPPSHMAPVTSYAPMLARVIPAVVTVRVIGETRVPIDIAPRGGDGMARPMSQPRTEPFRSGGSGVIVDAERGLIITNNHVIEGARWIQVALSDGRVAMAELVGRDVGTDVAVLRIAMPALPSLPIGDSDAMQVGDVILAVGNPFGLEGTATMGIVSAVMRTEIGHGAFEDYLQIDASINPGNSGGALVNVSGELVGINTAGGAGASSGGGAGIGFAIPVNMAMTIMRELITAGRMRRGSPGLIVEDLPAEMAMLKSGGVIRGALVTRVLPRSSAAMAGVKPGDIVVAAAGKPVRGALEYTTRTVTVPLGSSIPFILYSEGAGKVVSLEATDVVLEPEGRRIPDEAGSIAGAVVGEILLGNPLYGDVRGAQVLSVPAGSPAHTAGLEVDDVITGVETADVRTVDQLLGRLARAGLQFRIRILRNGQPGWVRVSR